jgi:enolase
MSSITITRTGAEEILDSRGDPTLKAWVELSNGERADAAVPSGASTGAHEAHELRDGGSRFGGKGETKAVGLVTTVISDALRGMDVTDQEAIDSRMIGLDGTPDRSRLGAESLLGVSLACARAGSLVEKKPLYRYLRDHFSLPEPRTFPKPMCNILNGGRHADNGISFQEYLVLPEGATFELQIERAWNVLHALKSILVERKERTTVGDEGGFAPILASNEEGLHLIADAIQAAQLNLGKDIALGIDAASSEFYDAERGVYVLKPDGKEYHGDDLVKFYATLVKTYHLHTIEDGCAEDDHEAWKKLTAALGRKVMLIGDDFFVTQKERLLQGIREKAANAILIKPNQVGTLTETMDTIATARKAKYACVVSHRSGETNDDFIADLAVAAGSPYLKAGSLTREERLAKYNRLLEIAREVGA